MVSPKFGAEFTFLHQLANSVPAPCLLISYRYSSTRPQGLPLLQEFLALISRQFSLSVSSRSSWLSLATGVLTSITSSHHEPLRVDNGAIGMGAIMPLRHHGCAILSLRPLYESESPPMKWIKWTWLSEVKWVAFAFEGVVPPRRWRCSGTRVTQAPQRLHNLTQFHFRREVRRFMRFDEITHVCVFSITLRMQILRRQNGNSPEVFKENNNTGHSFNFWRVILHPD